MAEHGGEGGSDLRGFFLCFTRPKRIGDVSFEKAIADTLQMS